ncbi:type IV secretion protein Rhs [Pseudomonas syringae CC1557]|uniref:Type IV secretion protein Rhs n=1 Tax=Pseudomonas syringae CC1557 TaxID=1357279 RepID=W0MWR2_PSESX|nr:contractile injection system protein, VgrG/Pvc8 family [Pseudomonas syringae]AHG42877.1 type IV secretion protein Rhs [Pseudomonas syringae CC1557]
MPDPANAPLFRLEIARLYRRFDVISFSVKEAISQPFVFDIEILGDGFDMDLVSLMYKPAYLSSDAEQGFHGQIHSATRSHYQPGPAYYTLTMGPRLSCLGLRYTSRIFQHMTATRIIAQVLDEHGLKNGYRFDLNTECRERECCVQYHESDLQLVHRLCAEENIHYHFVHSRRHHQLVFGNDGSAPPARPPRPPIAQLQRAWLMGPYGEHVRRDASERVQVRFEWDIHARANCWLNIAPGLDFACLGGMPVLVSFAEDDSQPPLITGGLQASSGEHLASLEPPHHGDAPSPSDNVHMRLDWQTISGEQRRLQLQDGTHVEIGKGSELTVKTGQSTLRFDHDAVELSGPRISFTGKANDQPGDPNASG